MRQCRVTFCRVQNTAVALGHPGHVAGCKIVKEAVRWSLNRLPNTRIGHVACGSKAIDKLVNQPAIRTANGIDDDGKEAEVDTKYRTSERLHSRGGMVGFARLAMSSAIARAMSQAASDIGSSKH